MSHSLIERARHIKGLLLAGAIIAALMVASMATAGVAQAGYPWSLKTLPGNTWTINEEVQALWRLYAHGETSSSICVGPVQRNGGGWSGPYGWSCQAREVAWEFPAVWAYPAVYNPNPGTIYEVWGYTD